MLDSVSHLPAGVAAEFLLNPVLVVCLSLSDASLQRGSGTTVLIPVPRSESTSSIHQQFRDFFFHPGLLVWKHLDVLLHCDGLNTVLDVAECC